MFSKKALQAAIDFGNSNIDAVASLDNSLHSWTQPAAGRPTADVVQSVLAARGLALSQVEQIAVTGGHHHLLPDEIDGCPVVHINEVDAIGRGGQTLAGALAARQPVLVVSGGSGVAMISAHGTRYTHVTGTGVGGGTLRGLGQLLLGTGDPGAIDQLAQAGDPNAVDLTLPDVVSGPIGSLPPDTTAVNFGRIAQLSAPARREDLAAALVTLVGQVVATIAVNAARAEGIEHVVVTGHLTDMSSLRSAIARTGKFFGFAFIMPEDGGRATALGALYLSLAQGRGAS